MSEGIYFDKYDNNGAYHWVECDRRYRNWKQYNPALEARYEIIAGEVSSLGVRGSLLDVGCGDGYLMGRLAPLMKRVTGVDSESNAIRWAKEKLSEFSNCEPIHTTCYDLPFAHHTFDIVTSADVIEHLRQPAHHIEEIFRVLKPGGWLVLTTPKWRPDRKWDERHEKEYRPAELHALLSERFDSVTLKYFWPMTWSHLYETKLGWRLLKLGAIQLWNPFLRSCAGEAAQFGQIIAVCRAPLPTD